MQREAGSIHLFRIRGRLNSESVTLKKNWIWDVLEIDWLNVNITLNDDKIDLASSVIIPFKEQYRARRLLRKHLLLYYFMLKHGKTSIGTLIFSITEQIFSQSTSFCQSN